MAFLTWTTDLETGISIIDEQHQTLVEKMNAFAEAYGKGVREDIQKSLRELVDFAALHFRHEEEMMEKAQYHMLEPHKKVHQHFIEKVAALQGRWENGDNSAMDELFTLLEGWLFRHIHVNDQGYVATVKEARIA